MQFKLLAAKHLFGVEPNLFIASVSVNPDELADLEYAKIDVALRIDDWQNITLGSLQALAFARAAAIIEHPART